MSVVLLTMAQSLTKELGGSSLEAFWANISFLLVVTVVQPVYTTISEAVGRKLPLYVAFLLFGVGSVVFSCAKSLQAIIAARVLQGSGCGGIDVLNEIIAADITTMPERAFYLGLMSIPFALGSVLGPILGALFDQYMSWRWIGWINLPLVGLCLPLTASCLRLERPPGSLLKHLWHVDWFGLVIFTAGSVSLALPLSWAGVLYPWASWRTLVPLAAGAVFLVLLFWYESKQTSQALFPKRVIGNRAAATALILSFIHGLLFYTLIFHLPLFLQSVHLETPIMSSVTLLPFFSVTMASTGVAAVGLRWSSKCRLWVRLSWVLILLGISLFALWGSAKSTTAAAGCLFIVAIGLGSLFTLLPITMQASAEKSEDQGLAAGILVSFRLFGASIGLSISATVFSDAFGRVNMLKEEYLPGAQSLNPNHALALIPQLGELLATVADSSCVLNAYLRSFRNVFYTLTAFSGFGLLVSLWMKRTNIKCDHTAESALDD